MKKKNPGIPGKKYTKTLDFSRIISKFMKSHKMLEKGSTFWKRRTQNSFMLKVRPKPFSIQNFQNFQNLKTQNMFLKINTLSFF